MEFRAEDQEIDQNVVNSEVRFIEQQQRSIKPNKPVMSHGDAVAFVESGDSDDDFDSDESQD